MDLDLAITFGNAERSGRRKVLLKRMQALDRSRGSRYEPFWGDEKANRWPVLFAFACFAATLLAVSAEPLDVWRLRHVFQPPGPPLLTSSSPQYPFLGLAFGRDLYVAVRDNGTILTTPDPDTSAWTLRESGTTASLVGIVHDDASGAFVAVGSGGTILSSTDGITWTQPTSGTTAGLNAVARGDGLFVAVGESGAILTSPDAVLWTQQTATFHTSPPPALSGVGYGNGIYVVVGLGTIMTSPDGVRWGERNIPASVFGTPLFTSVTSANGLYVVSGSDLLISSDGVNWTEPALP